MVEYRSAAEHIRTCYKNRNYVLDVDVIREDSSRAWQKVVSDAETGISGRLVEMPYRYEEVGDVLDVDPVETWA